MSDDEVSSTSSVAARVPVAMAQGSRRRSGADLDPVCTNCLSQIDRLLSPPFVDNLGRFRYRLFCETLRVTDQEV